MGILTMRAMSTMTNIQVKEYVVEYDPYRSKSRRKIIYIKALLEKTGILLTTNNTVKDQE